MTDTRAKAWAPAVPIAGGGGSASASVDAPSIPGGSRTPFDFFPFTPSTRNKQKRTAWEEAGYAFFCAAFHLFCFSVGCKTWNQKMTETPLPGEGEPGTPHPI